MYAYTYSYYVYIILVNMQYDLVDILRHHVWEKNSPSIPASDSITFYVRHSAYVAAEACQVDVNRKEL